ncbi:hypothetical protein [uncultured Thiohalocapsa sp.]|uniref:hypothetical protein n=1 Tax=uncultured Thiohalocapsa sp. TaxID=768990 RepID=UPI00345D9E1E
MKKTDTPAQQEDDLQPEYDLRRLRVRKFGPGRKAFPDHGVLLNPGVAAMFPESAAVNEALRFLMRVTREGAASAKTETTDS